MNPLIQMFNDPYIQERAKQHQKAQQEHQAQVENILKSAEKLKDFLDSLDEIKLEYREEASRQFCTILLEFINKHA